MNALTVKDLVEKYKCERCSVELRNRVWCLCKDGKVVTRITSSKKAVEFLREIERM